MKKIIMMMAVLLLSIGVYAVPVSAEVYEENGFKYEVYNKEATVTGAKVEGEQLVIPNELGGFPVTEIGGGAFRKNEFTSIQLPDSLKSISWDAFRNSKKLKTIQLPENLERIGGAAFYNCTKLETIQFNNKLKEIDYAAFSNCISLKKLELPNSLTSIYAEAFEKCYKLKSVKFGKKLDYIGEDAFYKNYALQTITIPAGVSDVASRAFQKCEGLTTVRFAGKTTKLQTGVFYKCTSLKNVVLPKKLKNIPEDTFYGCTSLAKIKLPKNVSIIKKKAFFNCEKLTQIKLNKKIYAMGDSAFAYSGLKKMTLNDKMQFIGNGALKGTKIRNFKITSKVAFIGNSVFANCEKLKKIYVPGSVKGINPGAFQNCISLQEINVSADNKSYSSESGVLYNKDKTTLIQYPLNKKSSTFTTPSSVEKIRKYAFAENPYLKKLTINADIIGDCACYDMDSLASVVITSGTTKIGRYAFEECFNLKNVSLPDSVEMIEYHAFRATKIREVNIPSNLETMNDAFEECKNLKIFTGGTGSKYKVEDGVLYNGDKTTLIQYPAKKSGKIFTVPDSVKKVENEAFANNSKLRKIEFGANVERLKYHAMYNLKNLKSIVFSSKKLTSASYSAISQCDKLAVVVGPNTYTLKNLAYNADATMITL